MQPHHFIHLMDVTISSTCSEPESAQQSSIPSHEEIEQTIIHEWLRLQQTPSYVEGLLNANRGLIEGIATQS